MVKETHNVEFNETNGSQEEQENLDDVGNEGLRSAIKNMSIGDIKSKEEDEQEDDPSTSIWAIPSSSTTNDQVQAHNVKNKDNQLQ